VSRGAPKRRERQDSAFACGDLDGVDALLAVAKRASRRGGDPRFAGSRELPWSIARRRGHVLANSSVLNFRCPPVVTPRFAFQRMAQIAGRKPRFTKTMRTVAATEAQPSNPAPVSALGRPGDLSTCPRHPNPIQIDASNRRAAREIDLVADPGARMLGVSETRICAKPVATASRRCDVGHRRTSPAHRWRPSLRGTVCVCRPATTPFGALSA